MRFHEVKVAVMIYVTDKINLPDSEYNIQFTRSSGPGGQNVNKVNSKAILTWDINHSQSLPPEVRQRFLQQYKNRINQDGFVVISGERYRDQPMNIKDCKEKLAGMILAVLKPPKKRIATKPTKSSINKRIASKKNRSDLKKNRKKIEY